MRKSHESKQGSAVTDDGQQAQKPSNVSVEMPEIQIT